MCAVSGARSTGRDATRYNTQHEHGMACYGARHGARAAMLRCCEAGYASAHIIFLAPVRVCVCGLADRLLSRWVVLVCTASLRLGVLRLGSSVLVLLRLSRSRVWSSVSGVWLPATVFGHWPLTDVFYPIIPRIASPSRVPRAAYSAPRTVYSVPATP